MRVRYGIYIFVLFMSSYKALPGYYDFFFWNTMKKVLWSSYVLKFVQFWGQKWNEGVIKEMCYLSGMNHLTGINIFISALMSRGARRSRTGNTEYITFLTHLQKKHKKNFQKFNVNFIWNKLKYSLLFIPKLAIATLSVHYESLISLKKANML